MALPLYLAQTAAEMAGNPHSGQLAWMACHFSPGGSGLSNLPPWLPEGAMLILDDSYPMDGHDPAQILEQLVELIARHSCESLLLDFQRPGLSCQQELAKRLGDLLPCPVGVSELYAHDLSCPVFLPPVPPDRPLSDYLQPWQGRKIWLEAALEGIALTLTESGCTADPFFDFPENALTDKHLNCHYIIETGADSVIFHLWRTRADLDSLLKEAEMLGVAKAIGLWQELGK